MADFTAPNTWTTEYAAAHSEECIACIRETNQLAIRHLRRKNYAAGADALDSIRNGLLKLQNSGQGNYRKFLFSFCMAEAVVIAYFSPTSTNKVIALLKEARDFASKAGPKKDMEDMIGQIRAGARIDSEDFNQGIWVLEQMDDKLKSIMKESRPMKSQPKTSAPNMAASTHTSSVPMELASSPDPEFDEWIVKNNLTEDDLRYIKKAISKRMLIWLVMHICYFGIPFFTVEWSYYKSMKQRTFHCRYGFWWRIWSLGILPLYLGAAGLIILPISGDGNPGSYIASGVFALLLILTLLASKRGVGTALSATLKKGFVGLGEVSLVLREEWKRICRSSRIIRWTASAILSAVILVVTIIIAIIQGPEPSEPTQTGLGLWEAVGSGAIVFLIFFVLLDLLGLFICAIVNNIRYRHCMLEYLSDTEAGGLQGVDIPHGGPGTQAAYQTGGGSGQPRGRGVKVAVGIVAVIIVGAVVVFTLFSPLLKSANMTGGTTGYSEEASGPRRTEPVNRTELSVEEFERILMGEWSSAYREEDWIYTSYFDFSVEGKVYNGSVRYDNIHKDYIPDMEIDEYGWYFAPMGHPFFDGNYSLTASEDNRFTLVTIGTYITPSDVLVQDTYELTYVDDNTILINGVTYVRGQYTLTEYAGIFGFDIKAEDVADDPLR